MELVVIVDSESDTPLMEETVRVEPVRVVKYPVVVERVGTWTEDKMVREEVIWASCKVRKLDWMEEMIIVEPVREVK
jgi:hypothetical protein